MIRIRAKNFRELNPKLIGLTHKKGYFKRVKSGIELRLFNVDS